MFTVGIFPNTKKQNVNQILAFILQYLKKRNVKVLLPKDAAEIMGYSDLASDIKTMKDTIKIGITLGGDGTLLNTAREICTAGIPICGVNLGQLGFLTEIEIPELSNALEQIISGSYTVEERLMLDSVVVRGGNDIYISTALNDVVITKGGFSRLIKLELYIDEQLTAKYPADGLIISTSTGSTGYSLSAGGPIVNPNLKVIVLTPICPHTLQTRSLVISEDEKIRVGMRATHEDIVLTVDGQKVFNLLPDDVVVVRRSPNRAKFVKLYGKNYYEKLRTKLRRGDCDENS